tara:strand:- start:173 stop:514 length:342 start_codon:yes stop_codon:yes gene_type:complete
MLKLTEIETTSYGYMPYLECAVSGQMIEDATHANVIWVYRRPLNKDYDGQIIGDPIVVKKEYSPKHIVDKHLGIENDPQCKSHWMQLDEYLTMLCKELGCFGKEPDVAWAKDE